MRRLVPFVIVALAIAAFWYRGLWMPMPAGQSGFLGYVESDTVLVAAPQAGQIADVYVNKGAGVTAGTVLFRIDTAVLDAQLTQAQAAVKTAEATHANLLSGKRPAEVEVLSAQVDEAEAALRLAQKELTRASELTGSGTAAQSRLDQAQAQMATQQARLAAARASRDAAMLAARPDEIAAAVARIDEAKAAVESIQRTIAEQSPAAPAEAQVDDVFFDAGEWVSAGQPVIALERPDALTLRFFVPEPMLAGAQPGRRVLFTCDGCGELRGATILRSMSRPEYTPPVIYSQQAKAKLVFMVEARPDTFTGLRPGLPVAVEAFE